MIAERFDPEPYVLCELTVQDAEVLCAFLGGDSADLEDEARAVITRCFLALSNACPNRMISYSDLLRK
jgi:hypothetical protein